MTEINDTTRTFPRTLDEARNVNHWELDADEANPIEGPFNDHGSMDHYKKIYAWVGLSLWFAFMVLCTIIIIHYME